MNSAILISNQTNTKDLIKKLLDGFWKDFEWLQKKEVGIFSTTEIERFIEDEELHNIKTLTANTTQTLKSMSSGERKSALLDYLLHQGVKTLIMVNPYDNLDIEKVSSIEEKMEEVGANINLVQVLTRTSDVLASTTHFYSFHKNKLEKYSGKDGFLSEQKSNLNVLTKIPATTKNLELGLNTLVSFKDVIVSFDGRQVLQNINWDINQGEFWQLKGPNGSGKSTLLNMITGESHKGYGQNLTLFGHKKGSGESIWDIKEVLGYFTPAMVDRFRGYHSVENMLISGLHDSVGLYQKPSDKEKELASKWLSVLNLAQKKNNYFHQLSQGEKRLVMTARAMIKHPPLLILDEPTVGLDDSSANFFVTLINKFAEASETAIIFVSHRTEKGLNPGQLFELIPTPDGSIGKRVNL